MSVRAIAFDESVSAKSRPPDIPGLTSLRSAAAILVFVYHLGHGILPGRLGAGGYTGVAFFYVLSGFLLTWGTDPRRSTTRFYVRRFARIWPAHAVVWLLVLVLPVAAGPRSVRGAILNLLLLHAWTLRLSDVFSMNGVSWSLSCEVFFYALFPLLFRVSLIWRLRNQWIGALGYFAVSGTVVVVASFAPPESRLALFAGASPIVRMAEFVLGVVAARTLLKGYLFYRRAWIVVVGFALLGLALAHGSPAGAVWLAPVYLAVIVSVAQAALRGRRPFAQRPLVYAGKVSFCFYLVHQITLNTVFADLAVGRPQATLAFLLSCLLAVLLHHGVELPAHKWITGRFSAQKRTTASDTVTE